MTKPKIKREEPYNLEVTRYRDKEGNPTCAIDFGSGKVCIFYGTQKFGCSETCWFADRYRRWSPLQRRKGGAGTLIPIANCPLWKDHE